MARAIGGWKAREQVVFTEDSHVPFQKPLKSGAVLMGILFLLILEIALGGQLMHAADNAPSSREPWRISERQKNSIRRRAASAGEATRIIEGHEARRKRAWDLVNDPNRLQESIRPFLEGMKEKRDSNIEFTKPLKELENFLSKTESDGAQIPEAIGNQISHELIAHFKYRQGRYSYGDRSLINTIGRFGNSQQTKNFIADILDGNDESLCAQMISAIAWNHNLHGDAFIFKKLDDLVAKAENLAPKLLAVMARIDPERALPLVQSALAETKDMVRFIKLAGIISSYKRPVLLRPVLTRVKDFQFEPDSPMNPTVGIDPGLLIQFISAAEGENLELALESLAMTSIALGRSYPVLREKLDSSNPRSRRAAYQCISKAVQSGAFATPEILKDLETRIARENDAASVKAGSDAVSNLRLKLGRQLP